MAASDGDAKSYGRSAGLLTAALGSAGLLTYAFFAVASHSLSGEDYGRIVVLWSAVFITVSTLLRPVEQLLSRTVAELEAKRRSITHALRVAGSIQLAVAMGFTVLAFALRSQLQDQLFDGSPTFFYALVGAVVAFAGSVYARGFLAGRNQFTIYALMLVVEAIARLCFALVIAIGIAHGPDPVALGVCLAPALSLLVVPVALRRRRRTSEQAAGPTAPAAGALAAEGTPHFTLAQGWGFASAVLVIMLSEQVLLNSGPLFARAADGNAAAGFIFNVLMVARAPVVLFQAIAASLLPHLTRLRSHSDRKSVDVFHLSIRLTLRAIAAISVAVVLGVLTVGPPVMGVAFGGSFDYDRLGLALVGVGMGFYLAAATMNQAALARGQARRSATYWAVCAVLFVACNLLPVLDVFRRVELGFALSAIVLFALVARLYRRAPAATANAPEPGSPLEISAQLAAADEVI